MNEQFYYASQGHRAGPVSLSTLRELAAQGALKRRSKIWCQGMQDWQQASSIPKLFDDLPPDLDLEDISDRTPPPLPPTETCTALLSRAQRLSTHPAVSRLWRNPRTLALSGILTCLIIVVGGYYANQGIAHARWVREAPEREARANELRGEMCDTQRSRGRSAGSKFAQAGAVTGLLRLASRREVEQLAANVWDHPGDQNFKRIVGEGQFIYQIRATGGYYDGPESRDAFVEGFVSGYLDCAR